MPDEADLVVVGNPTNPTSVLHTREQILALRRPGRIVVVDEAFADAIPGEPESLAGEALPDVVVLRSLTKTWSLAGLRVGYALGARDVLDRLTARRAHWPLGTLQLEAIAACSSPEAVAEADLGARRLTTLRAEMVAGLTALGVDVVDGMRAVRAVRRARRRVDAKAVGRQGYCGASLRHLRRPGRPVPARRGASASGRCWSRRIAEVLR